MKTLQVFDQQVWVDESCDKRQSSGVWIFIMRSLSPPAGANGIHPPAICIINPR